MICFRKWFDWDKTGQGEVFGQHEPETHAERRDRRVWEVLSLLMWLLCLGTALRGVMLFLQIHVTCCPCLRPSLPPPALSFYLPWLSLRISYLILSVFPLTEISAHMHKHTRYASTSKTSVTGAQLHQRLEWSQVMLNLYSLEEISSLNVYHMYFTNLIRLALLCQSFK